MRISPNFAVTIGILVLLLLALSVLFSTTAAADGTNRGPSDLRGDPTEEERLTIVPLITIAKDGGLTYQVIKMPDGRAQNVLPIMCARRAGESTMNCLLLLPNRKADFIKLSLKTEET